jgi:centrin-3
MSSDAAAPTPAPRATLGLRARAPRRPVLSEAERGEIEEAFALFDAEKAGALDYHALKVAMRALGFDVHKAEVRAAVAARGDAAGRVSHDAFVALLAEKYAARDPEEEWKKAFAIFDEEGRGRISAAALRRVARELGEAIPDDELDAMIDEFADEDGGDISLAAFLQIMREAQ